MEANTIDPFRAGRTAGMATLSECLALAERHGYLEAFSVREGALQASSTQQRFKPEEVHVVNFYRFEGPSNPDDMSILYIIETTSGLKGTLTDAYGTYADTDVNDFMVAVQDIHKKTD